MRQEKGDVELWGGWVMVVAIVTCLLIMTGVLLKTAWGQTVTEQGFLNGAELRPGCVPELCAGHPEGHENPFPEVVPLKVKAPDLPPACPNLSDGWKGEPCLGFVSGDKLSKLSSSRAYLTDELKIDSWLIREAVLYVDKSGSITFMSTCQWQMEAAMRAMDSWLPHRMDDGQLVISGLRAPSDEAIQLWATVKRQCWRE